MTVNEVITNLQKLQEQGHGEEFVVYPITALKTSNAKDTGSVMVSRIAFKESVANVRLFGENNPELVNKY